MAACRCPSVQDCTSCVGGLSGLCLPSMAESFAGNSVGVPCFSPRRQCAYHQGALCELAACTVVAVPRQSSPQPQLSKGLMAAGMATWEPVISAVPPAVIMWAALTRMWAAGHNVPTIWTGLVVCQGWCCTVPTSKFCDKLHQLVTAVPARAFLQM